MRRFLCCRVLWPSNSLFWTVIQQCGIDVNGLGFITMQPMARCAVHNPVYSGFSLTLLPQIFIASVSDAFIDLFTPWPVCSLSRVTSCPCRLGVGVRSPEVSLAAVQTFHGLPQCAFHVRRGDAICYERHGGEHPSHPFQHLVGQTYNRQTDLLVSLPPAASQATSSGRSLEASLFCNLHHDPHHSPADAMTKVATPRTTNPPPQVNYSEWVCLRSCVPSVILIAVHPVPPLAFTSKRNPHLGVLRSQRRQNANR